jgi:alcohol dehydrogenase
VDAVGMEADRNIADKLGNIWRAEIGSTKVLENCISAVRRGGFVSVVGVYGIPYKFPLGQVFDKGIKLAFGQAPVQKYIDELFTLIEQHKIKLNDIITHRLPLEKAPEAYEIFSEKKDGCVKVILKP